MARMSFAHTRAAALFALLSLFLMVASPAAQAQSNAPIGIHNIIQSVDVVNGQLVATTTQGQKVPITLTAVPKNVSAKQAGPNNCSILNLALGPINLNLLGLVVQTSPICLDITAQRGGGLLGDLLCAIANLLNRGVPLADILAGLNQQQQTQLTSGLTDLLNGALNNLNQATVASIQQPAIGCRILNLVLGPLDLNLLGLRVELDNCNNGPVTLTVTAVPGSLLGDLLCGVLALINPGATLQAILLQILQAILNALPIPV